MTQCVLCGSIMPEGYGMVCIACCEKAGLSRDPRILEGENRRLTMLLSIERDLHSLTKQKLEKAKHDKERYARRITLLQGQKQILSQEYNAIRTERNIMKTALESCERRLWNVTGRASETGTGTAECEQKGGSGSGTEV